MDVTEFCTCLKLLLATAFFTARINFSFHLYPCSNSYYLSRIHHSQKKAEVVKLTYRIVIEKIHGSRHETTKHVTMKGF